MPKFDKRYAVFILPAATLVFVISILLTGPNITGFAVFNQADISGINVTLFTSDTQSMPENSQIIINFAKQSKSFTAKEFIEMSTQPFERAELTTSPGEYGYIGNHQYSLSLDKLGFTGQGVSSEEQVEIIVSYYGNVIYSQKGDVKL